MRAHKKTKVYNVISMFIIVVFCLSIIFNNISFASDTEAGDTSVSDSDVSGNYMYNGNEYTVDISITDTWEHFYNLLITITNTGENTIHNWGISINSIDEISGLYNAVLVSRDNDRVILKNAGYNQDIPAGSSVQVGYTASYDDIPSIPSNVQLISVVEQVEAADCIVSIIIDEIWDNGGKGCICIENTGESDIEDWILEFDSQMLISEMWNAVIESHDNNHYVIRNASYMQNIQVCEIGIADFIYTGDYDEILNIVVHEIVVNESIGNENTETISDNTASDNTIEKLNDDHAIVNIDTSIASEDVGRIFYKEVTSIDEVGQTKDGLYCVKDQILLTVDDSMDYDDVESIATSINARIVGCIELLHHYQIEFNNYRSTAELQEIIDDLSEQEWVEHVGNNLLLMDEPSYSSSDPWGEDVPSIWDSSNPAGRNWGIEEIDLERALKEADVIKKNNNGVWQTHIEDLNYARIGIIDTCFDEEHEDLNWPFIHTWNNCSTAELKKYCYTVLPNGSVSENANADYYNHGSHVAGIIGAEFNNNKGICGVSVKAALYGFSMCYELEDDDKDQDTKGIFEVSDSTMKLQCALETLITVAEAKIINYSMGDDTICFAANYQGNVMC